DSQRGAVLEDDPRRTLDLNRQRFEWIPEPADFELLPIERPALDGATIMVRHDLAFFVQSTDERALVGKRIDAGFVAGGHEIVGAPMEGEVKLGMGKARALADRLVVASEKPLRLAEPYDLHGLEIILEKAASGRFVGQPQARRTPAHVPQRVINRPFVPRLLDAAKSLAAGLVRREGGEVVVGRPAGDISPFNRLQLGVGELKRLVTRLRAKGVGDRQDRDSDASEEEAPA